jgi:hypothetical protein
MMLLTVVWVTVAEAVLLPLASTTAMVQTRPPPVSDAVYVAVATPPAVVVAEAALSEPQVLGATKKMTGSLADPAPVTVAVMVDVLLPSAGRVVGFAVSVTAVPADEPCCWITVVALLPLPVSVPVTVQNPMTKLALYEVVTTPLAGVVAVVGVSVPHAPGTLGAIVQLTVSPGTPTPLLVTMVVMATVDVLSAGTLPAGVCATAFLTTV